MLIIHGVTRSRASRIIWLCHELDLPFDQKPVIQAYRLADPLAPDARMNTRSPEFLALAPAGTIPVVQDGSLTLTDPTASALYLARKHGAPIGPRDEAENALMMQWCFYATGTVEPDALTVLFLQGREGDQEKAALDTAMERLRRPFTLLEDHLSRHGHLVADRFTVADLIMAEIIRLAQSSQGLLGGFPRLGEWLRECQARPAFRRMWQARAAEPEQD